MSSSENPIESVSTAVAEQLWKTHRRRTQLIVGIIVLYEIVIAVLVVFILLEEGVAGLMQSLEGIALIAILPVLGYGLYASMVHTRVRRKFLVQMAESLGLTYVGEGDPTSVSGHFFELPDRYGLNDVLSGMHNGYPSRIYELGARVGQGRNSVIRFYKVWEIDCQVSVPSIAVYPISMQDYVNKRKHRIDHAIPLVLEGDFNKHFLAFTSNQLEVEALQVLELEHLDLLMKHFQEYGFVTHGTKLYVFTATRIPETRSAFMNAFALADTLHKRLVPELEGVSRTIDVLHERFGYTTKK